MDFCKRGPSGDGLPCYEHAELFILAHASNEVPWVQMVPLKTLEAAAGRMRDKQPSVRKEAITAFANLFRCAGHLRCSCRC